MNTAAPLDVHTIVQVGPVIPVIVLDDAAHAVPLARALLAGGVRVMEVTLRTPAALRAIEQIAREVPEVMVGAGSVLVPADVASIASAGAQFAVSPGFSASVAEACQLARMPLLPGVATAGEVMQAREMGYTVQKCFPAQAIGGLALLQAWGGPFGDVVFCPTGGITPENARNYLALRNVVCVGGSWLVPVAAMATGDWPRITVLAREAAALRGEVGR